MKILSSLIKTPVFLKSLLTTTLVFGFINLTNAAPIRVIMDHDGAFEDYYNVVLAALLSQQPNPKIKLIALTSNPVGESYCAGTNRYPKGSFVNDKNDVEVVGQNRSIDGLTEKALSIAKYSGAKIISGCGESTAELKNVVGGNSPGTFKVELPLGGLAYLGFDDAGSRCIIHRELNFHPGVIGECDVPGIVPGGLFCAPQQLQCYYEFPKRFRDESLIFVDPVEKQVLKDNNLPRLNLIDNSIKASDYIAEQMCHATPSDPLIVFTGGPMTNLGRALQKIDANPTQYGCSSNAATRKANLVAAVTMYHMAGGLDTNPQDNFDANGKYKLRGPTVVDASGNVLKQDEAPETEGNLYFVPPFTVFAGHHDPYGSFLSTNEHRATPLKNKHGNFRVNNNKNVFNAFNNAEYNMFVDSFAADVVVKSGINNKIIGINATNFVTFGPPGAGLRTKLGNLISSNQCNTPAAQFVFGVQQANTRDGGFFPYDTLFMWDELAFASIAQLGNDFLDFQTKKIIVTTQDPKSGENYGYSKAKNAEIAKRDAGKMREDPNGTPTEVAMGINGNPDTFASEFQDYVIGILCSQK